MHDVTNRYHWRRNFLEALRLLAQASARLPFGVPDLVLYGDATVELYTGSLWSAASLDVMCANARQLTAELFVGGFRWSDRPGHVARGLWHADLQIGVDIIEAVDPPSAAEQVNCLRVAVDLEPSEPGHDPCLKAIGIEDLIVQQVRDWVGHGGAHGEASTRLSALVGLAREGVCGPLRKGYLRRSLARVGHEDVAIDMIRGDEGWAQSVAPRTLSLTEMHARIDVWRDRNGLSPAPLNAGEQGRLRHANRRARVRNNAPSGKGGTGSSSAKILLFDAAISIPPG